MNAFIKKASIFCIGGALFIGGIEIGTAFGKGYTIGLMKKTDLNADEIMKSLDHAKMTKLQKIRLGIIKDVAQWVDEKES